ncbi:MAG TPA: hypothetical protein VGF01_10010 [Terracidiphilus sp.]|jgi:hypothetical protein
MEMSIEGEDKLAPPDQLEDAAEEDKVPGIMPEASHAHAPHGHGSGIRWLDVIVTVSVVFISVVSLVVSIEHGRTMEKMVDQNEKLVVANTLPLLDIDVENNLNLKKSGYIRLSVKNSGVGPAIIDRFEIRYKGVSFDSPFGPKGLLNALFAEAPQPKLNANSSVSGVILPAREAIRVIEIPVDSAQTLRLLNNAEPQITLKACYCSVLDECWETDFDNKRPRPVKECKVAPGEKLW